MTRFPLQVVDAIVDAIGKDRTALRLSPGAYFNIQPDNRDRQVSDYLLKALESRDLSYLHVGIFDDSMSFDQQRHYSPIVDSTQRIEQTRLRNVIKDES